MRLNKIKITRIFSILASALLLFWWPLSHLFYSDWYHQVLGFMPGSYQPSMVVVIGICGFLPVMNLILIAVNPIKHRANVVMMMVFSISLFFMYLYLIVVEQFPRGEILNMVICIMMAIIYLFITPWRVASPTVN